MKVPKKFFIFIFTLVVLAVLGFYIFVRLYGKSMLESKFSQAFQRPVTIEDVGVSFPFGIRLNKLRIPGAIEIKVVDIHLGIPLIPSRQFVIAKAELIEPVFIMSRTADADFVWGELPPEDSKGTEEVSDTAPSPKTSSEAKSVTKSVTKSKSKIAGLLVEFLEINNGQMRFSDGFSKKFKEIRIVGLDMKARALSYPLRSMNTKFDFTCKIFSEQLPISGSQVEGKGWINFSDKNMDGDFKLFTPEGAMALSAALEATNNNMSVKGKVNIGRLSLRDRGESGEQVSVEEFIFSSLQSMGLAVALDFSFTTKMDAFQIDSVSLAGQVVHKGTGGAKASWKKIGEQFEAFGKKFYGEKKEAAIKATEEAPSEEALAE